MVRIKKEKPMHQSKDYYLKSVKLELLKLLIIAQLIIDGLVIAHVIISQLNKYALIGQGLTILVMLFAALLVYKKINVNVIGLILCLYYSIIVIPSIWLGLGTNHPLPIMLSVYTAIIIILLLEGRTRLSVIVLYIFISTSISIVDIIKLTEGSSFLESMSRSFSLYILYSLISMTVWVFKDKFIKLSEDIYQSSMTDHLTGASNGLKLDKIMQKQIEAYLIHQKNFAAALIDMDNFKTINDTYGHKEGDQILIDFVEHANKFIRANDLLFRYGGDEFIIVFANCDKETAYKVLARLLFETHSIDTITDISFSAGICDYEEALSLGKDILKLADERMYEAKNNGKNAIIT